MEVSGDEGLAAILAKAQQGQQLDVVENQRLQFFYMSIFVKWQ
jgi:hypothetical protein